jgi:hypothetical protein
MSTQCGRGGDLNVLWGEDLPAGSHVVGSTST